MPAATKKTSSVKKAPVKKSTAKNKAVETAKKPAAKTTAKTAATKKASTSTLRSFRPSPLTEPFFTFRITRQTIYWLILSVIVIGLAVWVVQINARVQAIYDQVDQNDAALQDLSTKKTPTSTKTPVAY